MTTRSVLRACTAFFCLSSSFLLLASDALGQDALPPPSSGATAAVPAPAEAPRAPVVDPAFAVGFSGTAGVDFLFGRAQFNEELRRHGYEDLGVATGAFGLRASGFIHGWELSFAPKWKYWNGADDPSRGPTFSGVSLYMEAAYDLLSQQVFTFAPTIGFGWSQSSVCVRGSPEDVPSNRGPMFSQVLDHPGKESCLETEAVVMRGGFVLGLAIESDMSTGGGTVFVNLRPTFEWPLQSSRYTVEYTDLPAFSGPHMPHPGFGLVYETGIVFGGGRR
ncbi:MAG: hypothetical protein HOW73_12235 [Polyangiaceae bacterium]|nr:hypothetical protein [Polyangiaceae bacterium]